MTGLDGKLTPILRDYVQTKIRENAADPGAVELLAEVFDGTEGSTQDRLRVVLEVLANFEFGS
jgi:hypothetical protein